MMQAHTWIIWRRWSSNGPPICYEPARPRSEQKLARLIAASLAGSNFRVSPQGCTPASWRPSVWQLFPAHVEFCRNAGLRHDELDQDSANNIRHQSDQSDIHRDRCCAEGHGMERLEPVAPGEISPAEQTDGPAGKQRRRRKPAGEQSEDQGGQRLQDPQSSEQLEIEGK